MTGDATLSAGVLEEELRGILPVVLASVAPQAFEEASAMVPALRDQLGRAATWGPVMASVVGTFSAALASAAGTALASRLMERLTQRSGEAEATEQASPPPWLHHAIADDAEPVFATMTEFSNERNHLIREEVIGNRRPVIISRHGQKVAAIIPLEPGRFEDEVLPEALRRAAERSGAAPSLSSEQVERILKADDPMAAARDAGIDTSGWETLRPPGDTSTESADSAGPPQR